MRKFISRLFIILLLLNFTGCLMYVKQEEVSPAKTDKPVKTGCISGDCQNGKGVYLWKSGARYEGFFKNGKKNGTGTIFYVDGTGVYTGNFAGDYRNGTGVNLFPNGDKYEGNFFRNVPDGKGTYTYADGTVESGDFTQYLYAGVIYLPSDTDKSKKLIGKVNKINNSNREIEVSVSQKSGDKILVMGQKVFIEVNGVMAALEVTFPMMTVARCKMIGQTQNLLSKVTKGMPVYEMIAGIKRGNDTFLFPNGNRYVGEFRGKHMHGKGEFYWTNGNKYTGEYRNGMRQGKGTLYFYHGGVYTGEWKSGKADGKGVYTWKPGGDRYEGNFKGGWKNGYGICYMANGNRYEGEYKNDVYDGKGKFIWADGDRYEGEYKNDVQEGKGTYTWANGDRYIGEFKNGYFEGQGIKYSTDGSILQKGKWAQGKYTGMN